MKDEVKIVGLWELNWNSPLVESWQWSFPLREFEIEDWAMWPVTGIRHNEQHSDMQLTEFNDMQEMVQNFAPDGYTRVFIDEKGAIPLCEFQHPEKAVYFFGNAGRTPAEFKNEERGDVSVVIPTPKENGVLWPHQCLVAVLYDRMMKERKRAED